VERPVSRPRTPSPRGAPPTAGPEWAGDSGRTGRSYRPPASPALGRPQRRSATAARRPSRACATRPRWRCGRPLACRTEAGSGARGAAPAAPPPALCPLFHCTDSPARWP